MGNAELTAHQCIELPKNHAQRVNLQLNQSLELKCAFVIFAKIIRDYSVKMNASDMLRPNNIVPCARHTIFAAASEKNLESPYAEFTA
jgi:hypothetical protein